jgi:Family of unknown function (DUF6900)
MKPIDDLFTGIAREHLYIETLETRNLDSLDFHDVSVRGVKDALLAAYQAGVNDPTARPAGIRLREMREALERAEFLMRRVHEGDHRALENLPGAAKQARRVLARERREQPPKGEAATATPIVTVTVRGGLIEDMEATIPLHAVVEDWDIADDDTGKKPARSVWTLDDGLSASKAEKLRRLIAND